MLPAGFGIWHMTSRRTLQSKSPLDSVSNRKLRALINRGLRRLQRNPDINSTGSGATKAPTIKKKGP